MPGDPSAVAVVVPFALIAVLTACRGLGPPSRPAHCHSRSVRRSWRPSRQAVPTRADRRDALGSWPDAIDLIVLGLRAGATPLQAVTDAVPLVSDAVRPSLAAVVRRVEQGERFADALGAVAVIGPAGAALAEVLAGAERYGLPLQPVLVQLSGEARAARRRAAEAQARELPVRLAMPLVLCILPSFVVLTVVPLMLAAIATMRG